ncbi:MAG: YihY/virulence factor BrkB family protein [Chloroflexota bacterium]
MRLRKDFLPLLQQTWTEFQEDGAVQLGAALAYYTMFSIFPLLLLLISGLGFFLSSDLGSLLSDQCQGEEVQACVLGVFGDSFSPEFSATLGEVLEGISSQARTGSIIGIITLIFAASGIFGQLNLIFDRIWKIPKQSEKGGILTTVQKALTQKLTAFAMVAAAGVLLIFSLVLTGVVDTLLRGIDNAPFVGQVGGINDLPFIGGFLGIAVTTLVTIGVNALIFMILFKYLPATKVAWKDVWMAALFTAALWEIAKRLLNLYISSGSYSSAYGVIGTALILMVWIYFSSQILFLGAEFSYVYAQRFGSYANKETETTTPTTSQTTQETPSKT